MRCRHCNGPLLSPGDDARGVNQRRLCRRCWTELLADYLSNKNLPRSQRKTIPQYAAEYNVSKQAISQKIAYLIRGGFYE